MTDIYISYEWRIVLCAIFMLHIRLLYRTTAEKVKGVHRMRVEQQSQNIIDVVKQSIGPEEKSGAVLSQYTTGAAGAAVEKSSVSEFKRCHLCQAGSGRQADGCRGDRSVRDA